MKVRRSKGSDARRRGSALLYAAIIAVAMAGLCLALFGMSLGTGRERVATMTAQHSFYAAEAGLSDAYMRVTEGLIELQEGGQARLGSVDHPIPLGRTAYWVDIQDLGSRRYALTSTGVDGRHQRRLELVLSEVPSGFFQYAAFGADSTVLDSNSFIDSYDSSLGSYESQVKGGNDYALENGNVGSNGDIVLKSNTTIHGDATPGPGHVVDDTAPKTYISGSTDPAEEPIELRPIEIPAFPSSGRIVGNADVVLGPGEIHYDSILMMGGTTLTIVGPATLVADDFQLKSNANLVFDASAGEIDLYSAKDFVLESNSNVKTFSDSALDVTLWLDGNNISKKPADSLSLSANSEFIGAIYAPNAKFSLASNFNVFGSVMCGALHLASNGEIHFDEALLYDGEGSSGEYETLLWRRLPQQ